MPADARHRTDIDPRLSGERANADRDVIGEAEHMAMVDCIHMAEAETAAGRMPLDEFPMLRRYDAQHRLIGILGVEIEDDGLHIGIGIELALPLCR